VFDEKVVTDKSNIYELRETIDMLKKEQERLKKVLEQRTERNKEIIIERAGTEIEIKISGGTMIGTSAHEVRHLGSPPRQPPNSNAYPARTNPNSRPNNVSVPTGGISNYNSETRKYSGKEVRATTN